MDALNDRMKKLAVKIMIGPADEMEDEESENEVDEKLKEEGLAPTLAKVDKAGSDDSAESIKEQNKFAGMIVNGEDRKLKQKLERGEKPNGFAERVQMEAMKKRVTEEK